MSLESGNDYDKSNSIIATRKKIMKRKRSPIKWPGGARIAITPCVAFETWPEDLGAAESQQQENRRSLPKNAVWFARAGDIAQWNRENYRDSQVEEWPNFMIAGRRATKADLLKL